MAEHLNSTILQIKGLPTKTLRRMLLTMFNFTRRLPEEETLDVNVDDETITDLNNRLSSLRQEVFARSIDPNDASENILKNLIGRVAELIRQKKYDEQLAKVQKIAALRQDIKTALDSPAKDLDRTAVMALLSPHYGDEEDCNSILLREKIVYEESLAADSLLQTLEEDETVLVANLEVATRRMNFEVGMRIDT